MTTIGLAPKPKLTLFVKTIPALFLDGAVPEALGSGYEDATYETGGNTTDLRVFKGSLVQVYGYRFVDEDRPHRLPEPVKLLLPGEPDDDAPPPEGERDRAEKMFPRSKFLRWTARLDAATLFLLTEETTVAEALDLAPVDDGCECGPTGAGFTLRGADGRLYYVPEALGGYEILDDGDRNSLMLAPGMDRDDLRVRELVDDGAGGTIQSRAMLQNRAMLQSRAMLQNRAMLQSRAMLQNRAMMQSRAMMQNRAMMQSRAMMQARAMMQTHLHGKPDPETDDDK